MRRLVISFFLLSVTALSSSNVIPLIALHQKSGSKLGQIFDDASIIRASSNPCASETNAFPELCNIITKELSEPDDTIFAITDPKSEDGPDQWHKYPRQLHYFENDVEAHNADGINRFLVSFSDNDYDRSKQLEVTDPKNQLQLNSIQDRRLEKVIKPATTEPAIVLDTGGGVGDPEYLLRDDIDENDLNSAIYMLEIRKKANDVLDPNYLNENEIHRKNDLKTVVKKRYISLWSRLQAMAPPNRSQELPHRRHMHLFYHHLPEDIEGRPIPEDPRTLFKRPPGSPLRWG